LLLSFSSSLLLFWFLEDYATWWDKQPTVTREAKKRREEKGVELEITLHIIFILDRQCFGDILTNMIISVFPPSPPIIYRTDPLLVVELRLFTLRFNSFLVDPSFTLLHSQTYLTINVVIESRNRSC